MTLITISSFRLVNHSMLVGTADLPAMMVALAKQAKECATFWGLHQSINVTRVDGGAPARAGAVDIVILDDADQAGALGYHDVDPHGKPYARVFARPVLDHGGQILTGGRLGISVASVASHEMLEALVDPFANDWVFESGSKAVAKEVGDPVQADGYVIDGVLVSNFTTPSWFVHGSPGPWDRMGLCRKPFEVRHGGYEIVANLTGERSITNDTSPEWRHGSRLHPASRTSRRGV